jgi:transposase
MKFVATKTAEQLDLQALHRVRERLVSQRTGIINQIRAFMLERGIAVRQGIGLRITTCPNDRWRFFTAMLKRQPPRRHARLNRCAVASGNA